MMDSEAHVEPHDCRRRDSFRGLFQRAAAARALAGGAAEAMPGDADRIAVEVVVQQVGQMHALARRAPAAGRASG